MSVSILLVTTLKQFEQQLLQVPEENCWKIKVEQNGLIINKSHWGNEFGKGVIINRDLWIKGLRLHFCFLIAWGTIDALSKQCYGKNEGSINCKGTDGLLEWNGIGRVNEFGKYGLYLNEAGYVEYVNKDPFQHTVYLEYLDICL